MEPEALVITQLEDGTITLDNNPAPASIKVDRVQWEQMVLGELDWATVTQDPDNTQHLTIEASNVTATFTVIETGRNVPTVLQTDSWIPA